MQIQNNASYTDVSQVLELIGIDLGSIDEMCNEKESGLFFENQTVTYCDLDLVCNET